MTVSASFSIWEDEPQESQRVSSLPLSKKRRFSVQNNPQPPDFPSWNGVEEGGSAKPSLSAMREEEPEDSEHVSPPPLKKPRLLTDQSNISHWSEQSLLLSDTKPLSSWNESEQKASVIPDGTDLEQEPSKSMIVQTERKEDDPPEEADAEVVDSPGEEDTSEEAHDEENDEWNRIVQIILKQNPESTARKSLQALETGMYLRQQAQEVLSTTYETVQAALEDNVEQVLKILGARHETLYHEIEDLEKEISTLLLENYSSRRGLLQHLDAAQRTWETQMQSLRTAVASGGATGAACSNKDAAAEPSNDHGQQDSENPAMEQEAEPEQDEEVHWEVLLAEETSRGGANHNKVHTFLQARDRWQAAQDLFDDQVQQVMTACKELMEAGVVQTIVDATMETNLDDLQTELTIHLADNVTRRQELEEALQAAAAKQQSLFATLVSRVTGPAATLQRHLFGSSATTSNSGDDKK